MTWADGPVHATTLESLADRMGSGSSQVPIGQRLLCLPDIVPDFTISGIWWKAFFAVDRVRILGPSMLADMEDCGVEEARLRCRICAAREILKKRMRRSGAAQKDQESS